MSNPYLRYSDRELVALSAEKRHQANAWAVNAEEWRKIIDEILRRGIQLGGEIVE